MPHNRTRLWVGLAIVAVTIPAVGTYYYDSTNDGLRGSPIVAAGRWDGTRRRSDSFGSGRIALRQPARDYEAEVGAALARHGNAVRSGAIPDDGYDDSYADLDLFYPDEIDLFGQVATRDLPDPASAIAPVEPNPSPTSTDDAAADTALPVTTLAASNDAQLADARLASTGMTDAAIYRLVVNNLPADQRDEFVRAYAAMTSEQRADLIDGFRNQIQGGP